MPWRQVAAMNLLPYLNLIATVFGVVAEIIKAYVRHANSNGNGHA